MSKNYHFIAIGGSIMHSLAIQLKNQGHQVTGSDDVIYGQAADNLAENNLLPNEFGWHPSKIGRNLDAVILGMHAKKDNPELIKAQENGLKIYSFPEFVFELSKNKKRIVVGGSHGKTTITAMILHVLNYYNMPIDYLVGASLPGFDSQVKISDAPIIVLEGDEYLSSAIDLTPKFLKYHHHIGVVSGIEWDHANVFPTEENYIEQFSKFCANGEPDSVIIYNQNDPVVRETVERSADPQAMVPYKTLEHHIKNGITYLEDGSALNVFGSHNLSNMSAALEVVHFLGVDENMFKEAIISFNGANKRLQELPCKVTRVFLDFAHAPSKLKATVEALVNQFPDKDIMAFYELHTYSSISKSFINNYCDSMKGVKMGCIYFNPDNKSLPKDQLVTNDEIRTGFNDNQLKVINEPQPLESLIESSLKQENIVLLMSSGQFGGIDIKNLISKLG